jgi:hypothetical protein
MNEHVRTILAVTVLTVAIWVWADLEQTGEGEEPVPVRITVPADYVLRSVSPEQVTVKFKGPQGEIQKLLSSPGDLVCRMDLPVADLKGGRVVLHARDGFKHWKERRIVVSEVRGEHDGVVDGDLILRADRMVEVPVPVKAKITGAVEEDSSVQPDTVKARVTEAQAKIIEAATDEAKPYAVAPIVITTMPQNPKIEQEVRLEPRLGGADGILAAAFDPPTVKVTTRLKSTLTTKSLGRFPVLIAAPPEMLNRYRIIFQPEADRYVEVEVQGPAPDVERLNVRDVSVQLVLTADDKPDPASWLPGKPVVLGLPPGVKLTKPLPTINFNLEKPNQIPPTP